MSDRELRERELAGGRAQEGRERDGRLVADAVLGEVEPREPRVGAVVLEPVEHRQRRDLLRLALAQVAATGGERARLHARPVHRLERVVDL